MVTIGSVYNISLKASDFAQSSRGLHFLQFGCVHLPVVPGLSDNQFTVCCATRGDLSEYLVHLGFLLEGHYDIM